MKLGVLLLESQRGFLDLCMPSDICTSSLTFADIYTMSGLVQSSGRIMAMVLGPQYFLGGLGSRKKVKMLKSIIKVAEIEDICHLGKPDLLELNHLSLMFSQIL